MLKDFRRVKFMCRCIFQKSFCDDHEEGCRNSLTTNVSNNKSKVVIINHIKIIEISTNFLGRLHACEQLYFRMIFIRRENAR